MDAPPRVHLPKFLLVAFFEVPLILALLSHLDGASAGPATACVDVASTDGCPPERSVRVLLLIVVVALLVYVAVFLRYSWRAAADIRGLPYADTRFARTLHGVTRGHVGPLFAAFGCAAPRTRPWAYISFLILYHILIDLLYYY
jgi:hypothetical protein